MGAEEVNKEQSEKLLSLKATKAIKNHFKRRLLIVYTLENVYSCNSNGYFMAFSYSFPMHVWLSVSRI